MAAVKDDETVPVSELLKDHNPFAEVDKLEKRRTRERQDGGVGVAVFAALWLGSIAQSIAEQWPDLRLIVILAVVAAGLALAKWARY